MSPAITDDVLHNLQVLFSRKPIPGEVAKRIEHKSSVSCQIDCGYTVKNLPFLLHDHSIVFIENHYSDQ